MSTADPTPATDTAQSDRELHAGLLALQESILDQQRDARALAQSFAESGKHDEAEQLMEATVAIEQDFRAIVEAADDYFGGIAVSADGSGDPNLSANSRDAQGQLRIGPLGETTEPARRVTTDGSGDESAGTMRDYKTRQGDLSANQAGDEPSAGTLADYKEKQAKADARPVRIVDESDLSANSLTAAREREATETIHVVGTLASDDTGRLKTNATGTGSGATESLRATSDAERVRITDEPGADPVVISHVNTAGTGGTMSDYRARRDAKDIVVVNPDRLPPGAI